MVFLIVQHYFEFTPFFSYQGDVQTSSFLLRQSRWPLVTLEDAWSCFHLSFAVEERISRRQSILTFAMERFFSSAVLHGWHLLIKYILRWVTDDEVTRTVTICCADVDDIDIIDVDEL